MTAPTIDGLSVVGFNPIMLKGEPGTPGADGVINPDQLATLVTHEQLDEALSNLPDPTPGDVVADGGSASSTSTIVYDGGSA